MLSVQEKYTRKIIFLNAEHLYVNIYTGLLYEIRWMHFYVHIWNI